MDQGFAAGQTPGGSTLRPRGKTEPQAAGQCDANKAADSATQRLTADAVNPATDAGGSGNCDNLPVRAEPSEQEQASHLRTQRKEITDTAESTDKRR